MCPPAFDLPADMVFNGSDEQAIFYLERLRDNYPLPNHVIDLNPYECKPCNLPGEMWYLVCSTEKKRTKFGFWRQKESASEIFTNSAIIVWRTTLEFIEIQDALEKRTDWVMHEYKITEKGPCSDKIEKESGAICKVFLSDSKNSSLEVHPNTGETPTVHRIDIHSVASVVPRIETVNNGVDSGLPVSESDRRLDLQIRDTVEHHSELEDYLGDYLELNDLAAPLSHSTSYGNSSRSIFTSVDGEYFDSEALLRELDSENLQTKSNSSFIVTASAEPFDVLMQPDSSFIVTASAKPFDVIMQPDNLGSPVRAGEREPPAGCTVPSLTLKTKNTDERVPDHTVKPGEQEKKGDASCSSGVASSSKSGKLVPRGKRKATGVKGLKKCFCFMP